MGRIIAMDKKSFLNLGGLQKRWLVNTASVVVALGLVCVLAVTASFSAYYFSNMESDLKYRAALVNETENGVLVSIHQNTFSESSCGMVS